MLRPKGAGVASNPPVPANLSPMKKPALSVITNPSNVAGEGKHPQRNKLRLPLRRNRKNAGLRQRLSALRMMICTNHRDVQKNHRRWQSSRRNAAPKVPKGRVLRPRKALVSRLAKVSNIPKAVIVATETMVMVVDVSGTSLGNRKNLTAISKRTNLFPNNMVLPAVEVGISTLVTNLHSNSNSNRSHTARPSAPMIPTLAACNSANCPFGKR